MTEGIGNQTAGRKSTYETALDDVRGQMPKLLHRFRWVRDLAQLLSNAREETSDAERSASIASRSLGEVLGEVDRLGRETEHLRLVAARMRKANGLCRVVCQTIAAMTGNDLVLLGVHDVGRAESDSDIIDLSIRELGFTFRLTVLGEAPMTLVA